MGSAEPAGKTTGLLLETLFGAAARFSPLRKNVLGTAMSKIQVMNELWQFMRENKKYWLAPILIVLILVGVLLVLAKTSAVAPFIYSLF